MYLMCKFIFLESMYIAIQIIYFTISYIVGWIFFSKSSYSKILLCVPNIIKCVKNVENPKVILFK